MMLAPPSCGSQEHGDWVPIEEVANVTGQSVRHWRRIAVKASTKSLARKAPPRVGVGNKVWWVHRSLHPKLSRYPTHSERDVRARASLLSRYSLPQVEGAYSRVFWLHEWRKLCVRACRRGVTETDLAARVVAQAKSLKGDAFRISVRSLKGWWRAYNTAGGNGSIQGVEVLIDRRGCGNRPDASEGDESIGRSVEASDFFYTLYHCENRLPAKACHEATLRKARQNGWQWATSYSATLAWLQAHDDVSVTYLMRHGREKWARRYMPHLEIDYSQLAPGALYVCDHTQCDFWVDYRGKQLRPWLTAVLDCRSRCVVGWRLGVAPHQDAIAMSLRMACMEWGIPERMRIDNGRDYTSRLIAGVSKRTRDSLRTQLGSEWRKVLQRDASLVECVDERWMGIATELGIELIYAIPYSPWSKGIVERFYRTFHEQCGKTFATYCGNSALTKPSCLEAIRRGYTTDQKRALRRRHGKAWKKIAVLRFVDSSAVPTLEEARDAIGEYLTLYHHASHSGLGGRTPMAVWSTGATVRKAVADELVLLCQARGIYKVGGNGVAFTLASHRLTYGAGTPELYRFRGREVFITLDPEDVSHCYAWTAERTNRRLIGRLDSNERIPPDTTIDELREAITKVNHRRKEGHRADRSAPARTRTVAQELSKQRCERVAELRATGTDATDRRPNVVVVRTSFEGAPEQVRKASQAPTPRSSSSDRAIAAKALGFQGELPDKPRRRERPRDDLLRGTMGEVTESTVTDGGDANDGTDAGTQSTDLLRLIGGARHGQRQDE